MKPLARLALLIVVFILLLFIYFKECFSLWFWSNSKSEHMTPCPPGKSPNIIGICR